MKAWSSLGTGGQAAVVVAAVALAGLAGVIATRQVPEPEAARDAPAAPVAAPVAEPEIAAEPEVAAVPEVAAEPEVAAVPEPAAEPAAQPEAAAPEPEPEPVPEPAAEAAPLPELMISDFRFDSVSGVVVVSGQAFPLAQVVVLVDGDVAAEVSATRRGEFASIFSLAPSEAPRVLTLEAAMDDGRVLVSGNSVLIAPRPAPMVVAEADPDQAAPRTETPDAGAAGAGDDAAPPAEEIEAAEAPAPEADARDATEDALAQGDAPGGAAGAETPAPEVQEAANQAPEIQDAATQVAEADTGAADGLGGEVAANDAAAVDETAEDAAVAEAPAPEAPPAESEAAAETELAAAPATEGPATEGPATEGAAAESPATESPVTEAPAIEGPVTEALAASGRETEAPASDAAGAGGEALGGPAPDAPPGDAAAPEVLADLPAVAEPAAPETSPAPPAAPAPVQSQPAPAVIVASGDGVRLVQAPVGDAPPEVLQNVVIDTISYSPGGDVVLAGRGSGDRVVRLYLDNQPLGDVAIAADGNWRADFPDIDTGVYTLRADEIDGEGRVVSRFETPFQREAREVVAGTAPLRGARAEVVTVQPGFTLWGISRETYGAGILYVQVFEANRDQIRDPDLIYPGQIFRLPEIAPAQP